MKNHIALPISNLYDGLQLRIFTDLEQLESIKVQWQCIHALAGSQAYETDPVWFDLFIKSRSKVIAPIVLGFFRDNRLIGVIIGCREILPLPLRLGYINLCTLKFDGMKMMGVLTCEGEATLCAMARATVDYLRSSKVQAIHVHRMKMDDAFALALKQYSHRHECLQKSLPKLHHIADISEGMAGLLKNHAKTRYNIRNYVKKIQKEFDCALVPITKVEQVAEFCDVAGHISRQGYQVALGAGFQDNDEERTLITRLAEQGWLRCYLLTVNGEPWAFSLGLCYADTYYGIVTGYLPDKKQYSPGFVLFSYMIDDLHHQKLCRTFDWGPGDAVYKSKLSTWHYEDMTLFLFGADLRQRILSMLFYIFTLINNNAKVLANKLGITQKIKSMWRQALSSNNKKD